MSEVKQYIKKKRWSTIPKVMKKHFKFDPKPLLNFVALDPNTYEIVRAFNGVREMEFATNKKHLQPLLYKYSRGLHGKNGSPLICGWIIVQYDDSEIVGISLEEFPEFIKNKAMNNILIMQMQRIRNNLDSFTKQEKELIYKFLNNAESPNKNDIKLKIEL